MQKAGNTCSFLTQTCRIFFIFVIMYLLQPSKILKAIAPSFLEWSLPPSDDEPAVYLTFDDGPHPVATPFVLAQLEEYNAQATFFCIGKNVIEYPHIYDALLRGGHSVGNHTHEHLNGWNTPVKRYLGDVQQAGQFIESRLFRPPYGKIKKGQAK
jgi:peptidoglycan/xylan/chitin deacetylase (PgdA/CDA1 family)